MFRAGNVEFTYHDRAEAERACAAAGLELHELADDGALKVWRPVVSSSSRAAEPASTRKRPAKKASKKGRR